MSEEELKVVSLLARNDTPESCGSCRRPTKGLHIETMPGCPDVTAHLCDCGAGVSFAEVYGHVAGVVNPLDYFEAQINRLAGLAEPAPSEEFLALLRAVTGLPFSPGQIEDLDGEPLYVGRVVYDEAAGLHCIVADDQRAVRHGYTSWRTNNCWRRVTRPDRYLTVTSGSAGDPACLSWQDDDHQMLEILWTADTGPAFDPPSTDRSEGATCH